MRITARGWARDMGKKLLASIPLTGMKISDDEKHTIRMDTPGLFQSYGRVWVSWFQTMRYTGDYRMDIEFSRDDIMRLFKASNGSELTPDLMETYGLTLSPELVKSALRTVKLSDLTLGDLAAMGAGSGEDSSAKEPPAGSGRVMPFPRRVL